MPRASRALSITASILLAGGIAVGTAGADSLDKARDRLDAANAVAKRHQAEATAAKRAAAAASARRAALVAQEIAANASLRAAEDRTAGIVARLASLQADAEKARTELDTDEAAIVPLLPLITRLSLHPAATLIAARGTPGEAATGALAMQGITRLIALRASALQAARAHYATLSASLAAQQHDMEGAVAHQQADDAALQQAIATANADLSQATAHRDAEARAAEVAASRAKDLADVVAKLQHQRKAAAEAESAAARIAPGLPKSLRGAPVAGKLIRAFASTTATGRATGDTFAAPPGAVVSATCGGRIVFARPFASYGKLMIVDCGGGYDFVMSGFDRFDVSVGQHVEPGQPVGRMPAFDPNNPGNQPRLYVELRHDGTAIDPAGHFGMKSNGD